MVLIAGPLAAGRAVTSNESKVKKSPHNGLISPAPPFPLNACRMTYIQQNNDESHAPYSPWEIYQICRKRYEKRWDTGVVYVANTYRPPETPNYSE